MKAVVSDFGYTLVDEDRVWEAAANELGWPPSVFFAALGSVIEQRRRLSRIGPWAVVQQGWPEAETADTRVRELAEIAL